MTHRILLLLVLACATLSAQTENVILVTADGLRWQDLFRGIDPKLENLEEAGMKDGASLRMTYGGATPEERREKLLPFLWSTIAEEGVIFGNRDKGSEAKVRNMKRFSYPGYAEILVGRPQDDVIDSNALRPNPSKTVLEVVREELDLDRGDVALFSSWHIFAGIGASRADQVLINAGRAALDTPAMNGRLEELNVAQFDAPTPWGETRHDYFTTEMALEYMKEAHPRVLYVALDETDDWAHNRRYDRTLEMIHYFDKTVKKLWEAAQSDPFYKGKTTMILTTDHGRGPNPDHWHGHGHDVAGAEQIWIAAIGPETKARGEMKNGPKHTQSDVAPTILELLGIDPVKLGPGIGEPIPAITGK